MHAFTSAPQRATPGGSTSTPPAVDSTRSASSSMAGAARATTCTCGGSCPRCASSGGPEGAGQPLPGTIAARFNGAPSSALANVRLHTGDTSQQTARSLDAKAFTVGSDIHFAAGRYRPGTAEGDRLIAHEVAHAVQDGATSSDESKLSSPGEPAETEAEAAAAYWTAGQPFVPSQSRGAGIYRDKNEPPKRKTFLTEGFTGRETEAEARLIAASKGWVVEGRMYWNGRNWIGESVRKGTGKERAIAQVQLDLKNVPQTTKSIGAGIDLGSAFPDATDVYIPGDEFSYRPPRFGENEGSSDTGEGETDGKSPEGDPTGTEEGSKEKAAGKTGTIPELAPMRSTR